MLASTQLDTNKDDKVISTADFLAKSSPLGTNSTNDKKANLKLKMLKISDNYEKNAIYSARQSSKPRDSSKTSQKSDRNIKLGSKITQKDKIQVEDEGKHKKEAQNEDEVRRIIKKTGKEDKQVKQDKLKTPTDGFVKSTIMHTPNVQYLSISSKNDEVQTPKPKITPTSWKSKEHDSLQIREKSMGKSFSLMDRSGTDQPSKIFSSTVQRDSSKKKAMTGAQNKLNLTSGSSSTKSPTVASFNKQTTTNKTPTGQETVKKIGVNNFDRMMADLNQKLIDDLKKELDR